MITSWNGGKSSSLDAMQDIEKKSTLETKEEMITNRVGLQVTERLSTKEYPRQSFIDLLTSQTWILKYF